MSSSSEQLRGTSQTSDHATAKSQVVDGILEGSIVSLELLRSIAGAISVPHLALCSSILLSILTAVSKSKENTELFRAIAERSVQVVATVEAQLKDFPPSPSIQGHVRTLEEALKSVEDCVKLEGQRGPVLRVVLSQQIRGRVAALEQKLQDALSMFQIKTLLSIHDTVKSLTVSAKEQSSALQSSIYDAVKSLTVSAKEHSSTLQSSIHDAVKSLTVSAKEQSSTLQSSIHDAVESLTVSAKEQSSTLQSLIRDAVESLTVSTKEQSSMRDAVESLTVTAKEQSSTLQRIEAKVTGDCARSGSNPKVARYEDLDPLEELYLDSNYQIQSASVNNRMVITKVFHGRRAKQYWKATIDFSHRMIHPNLLHMKAISSEEAAAPFIVFGASCEGSVETRIASALVEDLNRSTRLGLKIVSGLSSGLNFLNMQGVPLASIGLENFEIFITIEDAVVIGINPTSLTRICNGNSSDTVEAEDESEEEALWRLLNDLCFKTFEDANHILYQEHLDREKALPEEPGIEQLPPHSQQAESDDNSQPPRLLVREDNSLDNSQEKPNVPPRRELVWMSPPQRGSATLALVAQHYKKALTIPRPGEASLLRQLSARWATRTHHRCKGYRKEEITLTTTIQQSAIVSHLTPLPREHCAVCGQVVEDAGVFNCVCGATEDDGVSPTIKCSICSTWQHLTCVNVPPRGPLYFSCNACTQVLTPAEHEKEKSSSNSVPPPPPTAQSPPVPLTLPAKPWPPQWLTTAMQSTQVKYPNDKFEMALRKLPDSNIAERRIKCIDCPGKLYKVGPGETLSNFGIHLRNRQHRQRVDKRVNSPRYG